LPSWHQGGRLDDTKRSESEGFPMSLNRPPPGLALVASPAASLPARVFHAALSLVPAPLAHVRLATADGLVSVTAAAWRIPVRPAPWGRK